MKKELIILRGVSGSGKTTLAKKMAELMNGICLSADDFFCLEDGTYRWDEKQLREAHKWCFDKTEKSLDSCCVNYIQPTAKLMGGFYAPFIKIVIVHNTFTTEKKIKPYKELAEKYGSKFTSLIVENRHGNIDVHNVSEENLKEQVKKIKNSIKLR